MSALNPFLKPPICAVCDKPVDQIEAFHDPVMDLMHYKVSCHGDTERTTLSALTMIDSITIEFVKAFTKPEGK